MDVDSIHTHNGKCDSTPYMQLLNNTEAAHDGNHDDNYR